MQLRHVHLLTIGEDLCAESQVAPSSGERFMDEGITSHEFLSENIRQSLENFPESSDTASLDNIHDNSLQWKSIAVHKMSDTSFHQKMTSLSYDQKKVFDAVKNSFSMRRDSEGDVTPLRFFVTGGAGSGKSFIISLLREYLNRLSAVEDESVLVLAPTGVAAFNIHGVTLHSAFSLPVEHSFNKHDRMCISAAKLQNLRMRYRNISSVIIDEISMVSYRMLEAVHTRLNLIKMLNKARMLFFGNLDVFAFGDFYQLKPVFGGFSFSGESPFHLWRDLFKPFFLTSNHRQREDNTYFNLLNRARVGRLSDDDLLLLQTRVFSPSTLPEKFENALRIFPRKNMCHAFNEECLAKIENTSNKKRIKISADELLMVLQTFRAMKKILRLVFLKSVQTVQV